MRRLILGTMLALLVSAPAAGATLPSGPEPIPNVAYGPGSLEYGAVFPAPPASVPAKVIVYVHGGYWHEQQTGVIINERPLLEIQREDGAMVFAIDYPQTFWPGEPEAVENAVRWVQANAARWGGDPHNIILLGSSAGGQLASIAGEHLQLAQPGLLRAIAELSGPGMNFQTFVQELISGETSATGKPYTAKYLGCHYQNEFADCTEAAERERSPIDHIPSSCLPWFISYGEVNDLIPPTQQKEMAAAVAAANCPVDLQAAPKGHAIFYFPAIKQRLFAFFNAN